MASLRMRNFMMQGNNAFSGNNEGKYHHGYSLGNEMKKWNINCKTKTIFIYFIFSLCLDVFMLFAIAIAVAFGLYWFERGFQHWPFCPRLLFCVFEVWLPCQVGHRPFPSTFLERWGRPTILSRLGANRVDIFSVSQWGCLASPLPPFLSWFHQCICWPLQGHLQSKIHIKLSTSLLIWAISTWPNWSRIRLSCS